MATESAINRARMAHDAAVEQRLAAIEAKIDQVLAVLTTPKAPVQSEPVRYGKEGNRVKGA